MADNRFGSRINYPKLNQEEQLPVDMSDNDMRMLLLKRKLAADAANPEIQAMQQQEQDNADLLKPVQYNPELAAQDINNQRFSKIKNLIR